MAPTARTSGMYTAGNVSYYYDANGNLVTGRRSGNKTEYFNSSGRIAIDRTYGNTTYRTDGRGLINSVTYGNSLPKASLATPTMGITEYLIGGKQSSSYSFSLSGGLSPAIGPSFSTPGFTTPSVGGFGLSGGSAIVAPSTFGSPVFGGSGGF